MRGQLHTAISKHVVFQRHETLNSEGTVGIYTSDKKNQSFNNPHESIC